MTTTTASTKRDELRKALAKAGLKNISNDILSKCVALSSTLELSTKQMAECWEAFSLNKNIVDLSTDSSFQSYRNELIKESNATLSYTTTTSTSNAADTTEGAIVTRSNVKRHTRTPKRTTLPMVTPPSKRLHVESTITDTDDNHDNDNPMMMQEASPVLSAVDAVAASQSKHGSASTPSPTRSSSSATTTPSTKANLPQYQACTNVGQVVVTFNPSNRPAMATTSMATAITSSPCTMQYKQFETNVVTPYRHMFTTLVDRSKALEDHLVQVGQLMEDYYNLEQTEKEATTDGFATLAPIGVPRQDKITCIGRICNEAHEGRINPTSVVIEGSRLSSGGCRINVDLSMLQSSKVPFSLFPGQIVAMEGLNATGRKLMAHRIVSEGVPHPPMTTAASQLLQYYPLEEPEERPPLQVMSVCGPYTTSLNLDYEPLADLMGVIKDKKPDVVIMTGPYVDMNHPQVKSGMTKVVQDDGQEIYVPFDVFFANKISLMLEDLYSENEDVKLTTKFVIVPSLDDATAEWVYPQPPFQDRLPVGRRTLDDLPGAVDVEYGTHGFQYVEAAAGGSKSPTSEKQPWHHVHLVSNPCTFQINEVVFGVTSTDVLFQVSADETNANLEPFSRLPRLAQHLLQQRNYYPLFPPHPSVSLDLKRMDQWSMPCRPDVLIVPSKLQCFAKTVLDSTVVVNPGRLSRETTGGTYALMEIHPVARETLENALSSDESNAILHAVPDRIRVEIKNI